MDRQKERNVFKHLTKFKKKNFSRQKRFITLKTKLKM